MKYLRATFRNYIGFYNGMGLNEVDIDFTKCSHNIILISGKNGSGKSTLLDHLNPFPDSSDSYIPSKNAEKLLVLFHEGDIYNIRIVSPCDLKGRKTTKAYITKNGLELNENGNVSSYKDIIFSEFELDSNYISLSSLSSNNRGLGDKTPAERKKFVSSIIDNLEVYNSMYKTLNKKSLVYKSHINTIHTKIQNIGDKTNLESRLKSLQSRESELNSKIMNANNQIVAIQAKNSIDEDEAKAIQQATDLSNAIKTELDLIKVRLDSFVHRTKISVDDIEKTYNSDKQLYDKYNQLASELLIKWKSENERLSNVSSNKLSIEADLGNSGFEDNISDKYNESCIRLKEIKSELDSINIPHNTELIFELSNIVSFCEKFSSIIDHFNDNMSSEDINFVINIMSDRKNLDLIENDIIKLNSMIEKKKEELLDLQSNIKVLAILENRPNKCKIDSCPFIKDAIDTKKSFGNRDIVEEIDKANKDINDLMDELIKVQNRKEYWNTMLSKSIEYQSICSNINDISGIMIKYYPEFINNFSSMILNMNTFSVIREHKLITDGINLLKMLDSESQLNHSLEIEYKGYREKIQLLNSSKAMLERLIKEESELVKSVSKLKSDYDSAKNTADGLQSKINLEAEYCEVYKQYKDKEIEYNNAYIKVEEFNKKSSKAMESLSLISTLRNDIDNLGKELNPIMQDISTISGQLTLLDSYYEEFKTYKESYNIIETLKKYCSPTAGGIQTLFMQIYMGKTKALANQVLSMLFNGNYQLLDFIINDNEFRIPFIGEGLAVDDISSGSSSQIAMMSMIINLVLLNQGSTKFNIARLDECDAGLDNYNRSQFVNVLFHSMTALNIEQLFIISHSMEIDNTYADIIKLKGYDDYESSIVSGNVIYDYTEAIKSTDN